MPRSALPLLAAAALAAACAPARPPPPPPPVAARPAAPPAPRPEELLARARALAADGDLAGAIARLEEARVAAPASEELRLELAGLLLTDGRRLDEAAALLDGAARPGDPHVLRLRGQLAELRGDDAGAAAAYEGALAVAATPELRVRRALALERLGRWLEAVGELEGARHELPDDPVVRAHLAQGYEATGRLAEAEAELLAAAQAAPERPAGWDRLARFYARTGRPEQARAASARAEVAAGGRKERALRPLLPSSR